MTTNVAATHIRLGIYSATAAGLPNQLLLASAELDSSTTGIKGGSDVVALTLTAGVLYFLAMASEGIPARDHTHHHGGPLPQRRRRQGGRVTVNRSFTYAALPASWGTPSGYSTNASHVVVRAV